MDTALKTEVPVGGRVAADAPRRSSVVEMA